MTDEQRELAEQEECHGCGWLFDAEEEVYITEVMEWEAGEGTRVNRRICIPCSHTHHSWWSSKGMSIDDMNRSQHTNLLLQAIRALRAATEW